VDVNKVIVKYLVERGVNVNKKYFVSNTPIFYACKKENENIVKYIVKHGADVNKKKKKHF